MLNSNIIGRFAPSPTGALHLGSLVTAVASYCIAKREQGQWLVRIEDTDTTRCHEHFTHQILNDLERLGLYWDGNVYYQSQHLETYHAILDEKLLSVSYGCECSRKSLHTYNQTHNLPSHHYPQLCACKHLPRYHTIRLIMPNQQMMFYDQLQGLITGNPQLEHGDLVARRRGEKNGNQGLINYMLAVVIDDALQGINQIVRGLDILPLTIPQLVIADYLALPLIKQYYHLPILVNEDGQKLSKQTLAEPIHPYSPQQLLTLALKLLHQPAVSIDKPEVMLQQAIQQWTNTPLYQQQQLSCPSLSTTLLK